MVENKDGVPCTENTEVSPTMIEIAIGIIGEFKHSIHAGLNAHGEGEFAQVARGCSYTKRPAPSHSFAYRAVTGSIPLCLEHVCGREEK